jgi:hypothetical protein
MRQNDPAEKGTPMKRITLLLLLCWLAALRAPAQVQPHLQASDLQIVTPALVPVGQGSGTVVGGGGNSTYYYWIVATYTAGNAAPSNYILVKNAPAALSVSNYIALSWPPAPDALTYDVLRTTTPNLPSGTASIAVTTGLAATSVHDTASGLSAYTISTLAPGKVSLEMTGSPIDFLGSTQPPLSDPNHARIYFDTATAQLMGSLNGSAYAPIAGSGGALTSLNGLTASAQYLNVGTAGTDFNIQSVINTHTFNIPDASATARGLVTTGPQTFSGNKTFLGDLLANSLTTTGPDSSISLDEMTCSTVTPVAGVSILCADSTANTLQVSNNGGAFSSIAGGGTVASVGLSTDANWFTIGSSPVTTTGTITMNKTTGLTANEFLATPDGSAGTVGLRAIAAADIPSNAPLNVKSLIINYPNQSPTGTTLNKLAKIVGDPLTAEILATSDTNVGFGVVVAGAGNTGTASIAYAGLADCVFDGATTAGDYVIASVTTGGDCHDVAFSSGYPTGVTVFGIVQTTNGGAGTYSVNLFGPDTAPASAGPGGKGTAVQINGAGSKNNLNLNSTTPAAAAGHLNLPFSSSASGNTTSAVVTPLVSGNTSTLASAAADLAGASAGAGTCADGSGNVTTTGCAGGAAAVTQTMPNNTSVPPVANHVVVVRHNDVSGGHSTIASAGTANTNLNNDEIMGIAQTVGASNTTFVVYGPQNCVFDNATTFGHLVGISSTVTGDCTDKGAPDTEPGTTALTSLIGFVNQTGGVAGIYQVFVTPMAANQRTFDTNPFLIGGQGSFPWGGFLVWDGLGSAVAVTNNIPLRFYSSTSSSSLVASWQADGAALRLDSGQLSLTRTLNGNTTSTTSSGVVSLPLNSGMKQQLFMNGNVTWLAVANPYDLNGNGPIIPLRICQDGTGGRTIDFTGGDGYFTGVAVPPAAINACGVQLIANFHGSTGALGPLAPAMPIHPAALTGQTGAISAVTLAHPMVNTLMRGNLTVACEGTSASATVTGNLIYTDVSGTVQTLGVTATCTSLGAASVADEVHAMQAKGGTNVQYSTTIANTPTYTISVSLETIQ